MSPPNTPAGVAYPFAGAGGYAAVRAVGGERSSIDVTDGEGDLGRPYAPFMGSEDRRSWSSTGSGPNTPGGSTPPIGGGNVYKNSAAGAMAGSNGMLPRTNSQPQIAMRAPFLSPASRPSSIWSPPSYPSLTPSNTYPTSTYPPSLTYLPASAYTSGLSPYAYTKRTRALMPSTRLDQKLTKEDKPWIGTKNTRERVSWWLTLGCMFLGVAAAAVICFFGWTGVHQLTADDLCLVLEDNFNTLDLENTWSRDVEMGGFGNGEFEMATALQQNLYIRNNQLYIMPTLTSDAIGSTDQIINGGQYSLDNCNAGQGTFSISANSDQSNCSATSDGTNVLPPVMSARISTKGHYSIAYGKVEVRAKLPRGDWLWPAIWMLPTDNKYGIWPFSGEIDIMEARGNDQSYAAQGINYIRSSLNYGPLASLQTHIVGWWQEKRFTYGEDFHTYGLEWTPDWMRFYVDTRLQAMMNLKVTGKGGKSFFDRGDYPTTAHNGSDTEVIVSNIWEEAGGSSAAPFDQQFFLILDLAAGGTSGWFPDGVGGKPWVDQDSEAMKTFAEAQSTWFKTWPSNQDDRAFRIDSVKMWKLKPKGGCNAK
ncbi:concanavalin A-like lectin/glucanase domain-containing protein [Cytidiella melzeri]|nr:concanavalin A-like lectin/glucanase domain-containing protein [Cytidiella melzeri]